MFGRVEELAIILAIIVVLFGGKQIPKLARGMAESVREVRRGFSGDVAAGEPDAPRSRANAEPAPLTRSTGIRSRRKAVKLRRAA